MTDGQELHKNEFRLRILTTNACDKDCYHCLNDFQLKPGIQGRGLIYVSREFVKPWDVQGAILAYAEFMDSLGEPKIITFSGGEPGLHPLLPQFLHLAKYVGATVKVDTNGLAYSKELDGYVDAWHIHVNNCIELESSPEKTVIQIVITEQLLMSDLVRMIEYYTKFGYRIKLFQDFFAEDEICMALILDCLKPICPNVYSRFTGQQINRGILCKDCTQKCITLKALWLFPDGTARSCPQRRQCHSEDSWEETMTASYLLHTYIGDLMEVQK